VPNAASPEDQKTGDSHDTSPPRREPRCQIVVREVFDFQTH
jgi:hypothetical protein